MQFWSCCEVKALRINAGISAVSFTFLIPCG